RDLRARAGRVGRHRTRARRARRRPAPHRRRGRARHGDDCGALPRPQRRPGWTRRRRSPPRHRRPRRAVRGAGALSSYRTKLRIAGAVALVGALVGLIAYAKVYGDLNALGSGTRINVPGSGTVELGTGTFALFQKTGD